jgi:hypothetical protein
MFVALKINAVVCNVRTLRGPTDGASVNTPTCCSLFYGIEALENVLIQNITPCI